MRILVVDELFDSRWAIADWLVAFFESLHVESAASGREALATIGNRRPDMVLTAHAMAKMDGIELARRVKLKRDAPLLVVMADKHDAQFELACAAAGADFWLDKSHLQARLADFLQQRFQVKAVPTRFA